MYGSRCLTGPGPGALFKPKRKCADLDLPASKQSSAALYNQISQAQTLDELHEALDALPQPPERVPPAMPPPLREERRLVMRDGKEGGLLSRTEFMVAQLASGQKFKKRTANAVIEMVTHRDFNPAEIRVGTIQQIEKLALKGNEGGSITRHSFWQEGDGEQDVTLVIRSLGILIEDLLADTRFAGYQYLSYEPVVRDGNRIFGNANGGVWWQINAHLVGPDHVLLGLIVYTDESFMKQSLSCSSAYGAEFLSFSCKMRTGS